jgi:hypothetical protein
MAEDMQMAIPAVVAEEWDLEANPPAAQVVPEVRVL